ncbi:MAG: acetyltransferase [Anaerolineales bacterium]
MKPIVLIGASEHAKVVIDIVEKENKFHILGLIDDHKPAGETLCGYPILGGTNALEDLMQRGKTTGGLVAIGDNWTRRQVVQRILARAPNFFFAQALHPSAQIARGASVGAGTVVMAGAVINSDSRVGQHCILNTHSSLDHDCVMGDFSSLAPGAVTGGKVNIGAYSAISLGAKIIHGVSIGEQSVLGAGALALQDIPAYSVAYGVPAKVIRARAAGEKYL